MWIELVNLIIFNFDRVYIRVSFLYIIIFWSMTANIYQRFYFSSYFNLCPIRVLDFGKSARFQTITIFQFVIRLIEACLCVKSIQNLFQWETKVFHWDRNLESHTSTSFATREISMYGIECLYVQSCMLYGIKRGFVVSQQEL